MAVLAGFISVSMLSGCGAPKLDGTRTVATVNGDKISMGTLSLFARYQQARTEQMYASIFGSSGYQYSIWSSASDEEGKTYGDEAVETALEQLELSTIMKQKAADYGVEVTDEDLEKINAAAEAFMAANTDETISALSVTKDDVAAFLELETIESRFFDPIVADADITVDPEEAQQSSYTYVLIEHDEETEEDLGEDDETAEDEAEDSEAEDIAEDAAADDDADDAVEDAEEAAEDAADTVEEAAEDAADTVEEAAEDAADDAEEAAEDAEGTAEEAAEDAEDDVEKAAEDAADVAEDAAEGAEDADTEEAPSYDAATKAQMLLDKMKEDPSADMNAAASEIDSALTARTDNFTTKDTENTYLQNSQDAAVIEALRTLADGEVYDGIVETDAGYYVLRMDLVHDEDETQSKIESVQDQIKDEFYEETTQKWLEEASIKVDEKVFGTLKITDLHTFTMVHEHAEDEEEAVEEDSDAEEAVEETAPDEADAENAEEAAEVIEETAEDAAEAVEETDETAAETVEETVEAATEAAEETVEAATEAVEETVEAATEAVEETVEAATEEAEEAVTE